MQSHRPPTKPVKVLKLRVKGDSTDPIVAETTSATVLFVDLRGYTGIAERLPAAQVVQLLEEFCAVLVHAIEAHHGEIYHVAGDGMMAGFGLRSIGRDGPREALAAGREMVRRFAPVATRWRDKLLIETGIGVGIHQGEVALGLLGPSARRTATLVGDTVNVAARLCNRARAGEVLFSDSVAAAIEADHSAAGPVQFLQLPQFELRGRSRPLDIWCVPARERPAI